MKNISKNAFFKRIISLLSAGIMMFPFALSVFAGNKGNGAETTPIDPVLDPAETNINPVGIVSILGSVFSDNPKLTVVLIIAAVMIITAVVIIIYVNAKKKKQ